MIHHISIAAKNPLRVAHALAEIWQGLVLDFTHNPGSYLVVAADNYGSAVEVHPIQTQLMPGTGDEPCQILPQTNAENFVAVHAAISVPSSEAQIKQIAVREGWRVVNCDRGAFKLIEVWVENRFLLEFLTPELAAKYLEYTQQPELVEREFGQPIANYRDVREPVTTI
jgi:hypothetical protein